MRRAPPSAAKKKHKKRRRSTPESSPSLESLQKVAILGRPNVGKSTLFNVWAGRRRAVVSATPGTTRDRIMALMTAPRPNGEEVRFALVDTGGIGIIDDDRITREVTEQIQRAIAEADVLLFMVDVRVGLLPLDHQIANMLRKTQKPVILAASKCETKGLEFEAANFQRLGLGEAVPTSAEGRINLDLLRERIGELLPDTVSEDVSGDAFRVCIVGRRNAGKSTFVNALVGDERVVVSEVEGTTRDPIDVRVEVDGRPVVLVDTAGVGRRKEGKSAPDHFSLAASRLSIERAESVVLLVDARSRIGTVERELAKVINDNYRPCVIVINKWDLAEEKGTTSESFTTYIERKLPALSQAPVVFISALTGDRIGDAASVAVDLAELARAKKPTSALNKMLRRAIEERRPGSPHQAIPKVYYATQIGVSPPSVVIFVNEVSRFSPTYTTFLENRFREYWDEATGSGEVPVRVVLKTRIRHDRKSPSRAEPEEIM